MAESQKQSLKDALLEADEKYTKTHSLSLLGMTALTTPNYINSMRSTMFTSHLKQFLNLLHPETLFHWNEYYRNKSPDRMQSPEKP